MPIDLRKNIENTINLAEVKSLRARDTLFDNTATIQERLTPEAMELLRRADALPNPDEDYNTAVNSVDYILLGDIRTYATSLYNHARDIRDRVQDPLDGNSGLLRELEIYFGKEYLPNYAPWSEGYYNVAGPHQGQTNEYYRIINVAHRAIDFIFFEGINSTDEDSLTMFKLFAYIVPEAATDNNLLRPPSTKRNIFELAQIVVQMANYQIGLYANYEIIKEAYNKIKNKAGDQSTVDIPNDTLDNGDFRYYQDYHAIVTLPDNDLDFAKRAANVAYPYLYPVSLSNVKGNKVHTAELVIYPARDAENKVYQGMTTYEWWRVANSFPSESANGYPSETPTTYNTATLAQEAAEDKFNAQLAAASAEDDQD